MSAMTWSVMFDTRMLRIMLVINVVAFAVRLPLSADSVPALQMAGIVITSTLMLFLHAINSGLFGVWLKEVASSHIIGNNY